MTDDSKHAQRNERRAAERLKKRRYTQAKSHFFKMRSSTFMPVVLAVLLISAVVVESRPSLLTEGVPVPQQRNLLVVPQGGVALKKFEQENEEEGVEREGGADYGGGADFDGDEAEGLEEGEEQGDEAVY